MSIPAIQYEPGQPHLEYGRVLGAVEEIFIVGTGSGPVHGERAVSCLVRPMPGDMVLLSMDDEGACFILSVLRRGQEATQTELALDGDVHLKVKGGGLSISSEQDISLGAGRELRIVSEKVRVHADEGEATIQKCAFLGKFLKLQVRHVKHVSSTVENICRRLTQRLGNAFRFVEEHDELQCGSARYLTESTFTMHSKNAMYVAEEIVTINGKQVHLG